MNARHHIILLRGRIKILERKKRSLEQQVSFLRTHKTLQTGMTGETIIAKAVKGAVTAYAGSYDVQIGEQQLEVKFSTLLRSGLLTGDSTRWAWLKLLGEGGNKKYDFLVLVGEKDLRWRAYYLDKSTPYVFFLIPRDEVASLMHQSGRYHGIFVRSNPRGRRRSRADALFSAYQLSYNDLERKFDFHNEGYR
jgi:hypothetical protein